MLLFGPVIGGYIGGLGDEPYTDEQLMGFYTEMSRVIDELFPSLSERLWKDHPLDDSTYFAPCDST